MRGSGCWLVAGLIMLAANGVGAIEISPAPMPIIPPLSSASPRLRFHQGEIRNNQPDIPSDLPDMSYPESDYFVVQWGQTSYMSALAMTKHNLSAYDPNFGVADFAFESPDGHTHVWVYKPSSGPLHDTWVYELYESGGALHTGGGSNVFLSTINFRNDATLNHRITMDFDAKLARAAIAGPEAARAQGVVLGMVFAGFGFLFTDPDHGNNRFVFMQVQMASSAPIPRDASFMCNKDTAGREQSVSLYSPNMTHNEPILPFTSDAGPLRHFHYEMNEYFADLLTTTSCATHWSAAEKDTKNWRLTTFYMGLETQAADQRPGAPNQAPQGVVEVAVQIAHVSLLRH